MAEAKERERFILGKEDGTTQKAHVVTGTESFAGLVISFYKISSITASNPNCERYRDTYLIVAVHACSLKERRLSPHYFYVEALYG